MNDNDFLLSRRCMREPIPIIFEAFGLLKQAVAAHLAGDRATAAANFNAANMREVWRWTDSLWGSKARNPDQWKYHRIRPAFDAPSHLPLDKQTRRRDPTRAEQAALIQRYGRNCAFCGLPLISTRVREYFCESYLERYPDAVPWPTGGNGMTMKQHAAFQCLWLQFDHVLPLSRGGDNSLDNFVVTCAGCNFGRFNHTLEECGLIDPRTITPPKTAWDGFEGVCP